eukprot:CAMPEP_0197824582 /NCGR_PEP_ID=MMETSP1437-20131217/1802_1 /TAXON_ID=49252 ORGANISM="Eucampia antarctica, Strain CCMP1452" /NCGR_SAMPLE_ID=MMETSP1437 /ASSEMBLY_ACC=CAM_ASM_001096 /LENGTH=399 /DNA_ID=CAMNT_0043424265 /DNA_START=52 /DNA_END=1248 /DNA_ORIENTATION=+
MMSINEIETFKEQILQLCNDGIANELTIREVLELRTAMKRFHRGESLHSEFVDDITSIFTPYPHLLRRFPMFVSQNNDQTQDLERLSAAGNPYETPRAAILLEKDPNFDTRIREKSANISTSCYTSNLHGACSFNPEVKVIEKILISNPDAIVERNVQGQLPLHTACINGASFEVIIALAEAYPRAVSVADNDGRFPLHHYLTIFSYTSWMDSTPTTDMDAYTSKKLVDLSPEVINLLGTTDLIMKADKYGCNPLSCFAFECFLIEDDDEEAYFKAKEILYTLLDFHPPLSAQLFKTIRSFPYSLVSYAANHRNIKEKLNEASIEFLFLATIMLDLIIRMIIIGVIVSMPDRTIKHEGLHYERSTTFRLGVMYIGSGYLFLRLIARLWSFKEVGSIIDW